MSKRETYEEKTEHLLASIVERYGVEIYDVEYVKEGKDYYLRVFPYSFSIVLLCFIPNEKIVALKI